MEEREKGTKGRVSLAVTHGEDEALEKCGGEV